MRASGRPNAHLFAAICVALALSVACMENSTGTAGTGYAFSLIDVADTRQAHDSVRPNSTNNTIFIPQNSPSLRLDPRSGSGGSGPGSCPKDTFPRGRPGDGCLPGCSRDADANQCGSQIEFRHSDDSWRTTAQVFYTHTHTRTHTHTHTYTHTHTHKHTHTHTTFQHRTHAHLVH